ncbi:MC/SLC25 family protein [Legionella gresilensis]|uniref:MC/SLC25 family protein n=1 Tax=Legionella gresilensis TaxID=91823 RepID=UPI001041B71E|nr:MC/SLC25 family protein [Legionella gresilensis]
MSKSETPAAAQNFPTKHVINFALVTSYTTIAHGFTYPFGTAFNRYQISKTKILSKEDFLNVVFLQQKPSSFWARINSLYPGFFSAGSYKLLSRVFKYCGQPLMFEFLNNQIGEKVQANFGDNSKPILQAAAGASIGILELPILHPIDTFKLQKQMGDTNSFLDSIKTKRWTLYNGWALAGFKNVLSLSTFFGVTSVTRLFIDGQGLNKSPLQTLLCASFVGAAADTLVTNPVSFIKKRRQVQKSNVSSFSIFKDAVKEEGVSVLYRGSFFKIAQTVARRAIPLALTQYLVEEYAKKPTQCSPK